MESDANSQNDPDKLINKTFFNKYTCISKLGMGSFGKIYKAEYDGEYFALKFEKRNTENNLLHHEATIMDYLKGPNIPYIKSFSSTPEYNILIMQLLGQNLQRLFEAKKKFSLKTICMIGSQMISILQYIHNRHIIHRDIKPSNFVMGLNLLSQYLYIVDFGLAKKYRSSTTLKQMPLSKNQKFVGTAMYASINAMNGIEQSRRDDLESVGYILIYFMKGILPWQRIVAKNEEERNNKILEKKMEISTQELCSELPEEFEKIIDYVKNLEYTQLPDYEMIRGYFNKMLRKSNNKFDYIYDWTTVQDKKMRKTGTSRSDLESSHNKKKTIFSIKPHKENNDIKGGKSLVLILEDNNIDKNSSEKYNDNLNKIEKEEYINLDHIYTYKNKNKNDKPNRSLYQNSTNPLIDKSIHKEEKITCCQSGCILF